MFRALSKLASTVFQELMIDFDTRGSNRCAPIFLRYEKKLGGSVLLRKETICFKDPTVSNSDSANHIAVPHCSIHIQKVTRSAFWEAQTT